MAWFKVDDGWWSHPKTLQLSDSACALWCRAGSWSCQHLTDGFIPKTALKTLGGTTKFASELVRVGYWDDAVDGWSFHDWSDYQEKSEVVRKRRDDARERMRAVRANKTRTNANRSQEVRSTPTRPDPTRPTKDSSNDESPRKRGSRIPDIFVISDDMRTWAKENTPLVDIDVKLPEFIDYWRGVPGQKGVKLDWVATWHNGMRKQQEFAERDRGARRKPTAKIPAGEEWRFA